MKFRTLLLATTVTAMSLSIAACGGNEAPAPSPTKNSAGENTKKPEPTETAKPTASTVPTVAGLQPGEMPPIPLIVIPDLSMADASLAGAAIDVRDTVGTYPGLTVTPATCDASGGVITSSDSMLVYGDGTGSYTGPDGSVVNDGDGGGVLELNGVSAVVDGNGAGAFSDGTISIVNSGDGSGTYDDGTISVVIGGDGSGTWTQGDEQITVEADGSGVYTNGNVSITNEGDGTGTYTDGTVSIVNNGDGTALVGGTEVEADPLPPVPPVGKFPPMGSLAPMEACGTKITLDAGVLFDFGKFDIRPEAKPVLDSLAKALADLNAPSLEVSGHTDSVSDDAFNQKLSEDRAQAVSDALEERGVTATITAVGYGETRPVAPNELNGTDNPAGRQLNRRVEIFVPAS